MKNLIVGLLILIPFFASAQTAEELLARLSQNEIPSPAPSFVLTKIPAVPVEIEFDLKKVPTSQNLLEMYLKRGGDVSGGGFGLLSKNSDKVILHDLWCNDQNYQFDEKSETSADGSKEFTLALARVQAWKSLAPALMTEVEKILRTPRHWQLVTDDLSLKVQDHFEFPFGATELSEFRKHYQEKQIAQVDRHSEIISLSQKYWNRMDLKGRAGLLVHESLRLIYIRSVKGWLVPGILQWMTGAIMLREPGAPLDTRMIESFYEELLVSLDNTAAANKQRPEAWRSLLCKQRHEVVRNFKSILPKASFVQHEDATTSLKNLCALQNEALRRHRSRTPWMNLGFTVENLKTPCAAESLNDVASYTLTYWMQKSLAIGLSWSEVQAPRTEFDIVHLVKNSPSSLTTSNYEAVLRKFEERGDQYCMKREDYYGAGQEFVALGDILLETMVKTLKRPVK